jgi:predicted  nucleic acid-binding Zn-ribbon protein
MTDNKSSSNKATLVLLALLLLASVAGNFYLYKTKDTNEIVIEEKGVVIDSLVEARVAIETELRTALTELENMKGESEEKDQKIEEQIAKLKDREQRIRAMIKDRKAKDKLVAGLRAELEDFKKEREQYLDKIDELTAENEQLKSEIVIKNVTNDSLSSKLKSAGALKVEYVKVRSAKIRYNGKEKETSIARRTEKMEVCFSIMDNSVAETGERTVYARIMQPDGVVLGEKGKFPVKGRGVETGYTGSETFNYDGSKKDFCFDFTDEKYTFPKGTYLIDIFIDGELHTSGYYDLR